MTSGSARRIALTDAQRAIVERGWGERVLVTAGAGAGKTTTLTYRLEQLTSAATDDGGRPLDAAEILVLSFSRAAVCSLRERIDAIAESARRVRAYTFDGWARSILHACDPDRELTGMSFDDIIEATTAAIRRGIFEDSPDGSVVELPSHIVIDEVQDLVGVRRLMVQALLESTREYAGFTVVGDAAQSVYGFQIKDLDERAAETNRFFGWLREEFAEDLIEARLDENFRARSDEARAALRYGHLLQALPSDPAAAHQAASSIYDQLRETLSELPSFGSLIGRNRDEFAVDALRELDQSTAILCATNGQVLQLSEVLRREGVAHTVQRSPRSRPARRWMVRVFQAAAGTDRITEQRFREAVDGLVPQPDRVWRSLRAVARGRGGSVVDLGRLHQVIAERRVPDDLAEAAPRGVVLTTTYRAKGLEFDRVLVLDEKDRPNADILSKARVLYVAMTRAREDNYRLEPFCSWLSDGQNRNPRFFRWHEFDMRDKYSRYGRKSRALEFLEADVARLRPAQTSELQAAYIQEYLFSSVNRGDTVRLVGEPELSPADGVPPRYGIFHGSVRIGEVCEQFLQDLAKSLKKNPGWEVRRWPDAIDGVQIDDVETVAGSTAESARAGLGNHGVWLAPRLCGLGRFVWGNKVEESSEQVDE